MGCFLPIQIIIKTQPIDSQEKGKYWKGEELADVEDTLYTRMVFNQLGELGQTLLSFFIGVQSVDSVGRSNSNHQKTLLRFDPRGKSLSSSLFPSELGPGNFRQRGIAINPLPHSTRWSPSPKFFLFRRIHLPSLLSSPCTFHRKEMLRDSRSKV